MKKRGFTLAEVLIALTIIGILAAITLPMINKFKPDTTKFLYLKTHDELARVLKAIVSNTNYYPATDAQGIYNYTKYPLANLDAAENMGILGGQNKLCRVLADNLNIVEKKDDEDFCKPPENGDSFKKSFSTHNGVEYMVSTTFTNLGNDRIRYVTDIIVDLNGAELPNCSFNADCKNPDRFVFKIGPDGQIYPNDLMGLTYLASRASWKRRTYEDYKDILVNQHPNSPKDVTLDRIPQPSEPDGGTPENPPKTTDSDTNQLLLEALLKDINMLSCSESWCQEDFVFTDIQARTANADDAQNIKDDTRYHKILTIIQEKINISNLNDTTKELLNTKAEEAVLEAFLEYILQPVSNGHIFQDAIHLFSTEINDLINSL